LAGDDEGGEGLVEGDFEEGVSFVVLEADVKRRAMEFDEVALQNQGFLFGAGSCKTSKSAILPTISRSQGRDRSSPLKVGTHPAPQVNSFADIQNAPVSVFEQVNAGRFGQTLPISPPAVGAFSRQA
jgi:hypothetical protein